jgi:hypothetical protein
MHISKVKEKAEEKKRKQATDQKAYHEKQRHHLGLPLSSLVLPSLSPPSAS